MESSESLLLFVCFFLRCGHANSAPVSVSLWADWRDNMRRSSENASDAAFSRWMPKIAYHLPFFRAKYKQRGAGAELRQHRYSCPPSVLMVIEELGEEFASRADQTEQEGSSLITAPSYQNGGSVSRKSYICARRKWNGASVELVAHDATVQEAGASAMIT